MKIITITFKRNSPIPIPGEGFFTCVEDKVDIVRFVRPISILKIEWVRGGIKVHMVAEYQDMSREEYDKLSTTFQGAT